jgi:hypothetical protein
VQLNADGDVASIFDKSLGRELLATLAQFAISYDNPQQWPAWNMDWDVPLHRRKLFFFKHHAIVQQGVDRDQQLARQRHPRHVLVPQALKEARDDPRIHVSVDLHQRFCYMTALEPRGKILQVRSRSLRARVWLTCATG